MRYSTFRVAVGVRAFRKLKSHNSSMQQGSPPLGGGSVKRYATHLKEIVVYNIAIICSEKLMYARASTRMYDLNATSTTIIYLMRRKR